MLKQLQATRNSSISLSIRSYTRKIFTMAQLRKYYEEIIGMSLRSIDFTLPVPVPDEEKKLTLILFISTFLCSASEGFIKPLKTFIKPFEAPIRSMKIKI